MSPEQIELIISLIEFVKNKQTKEIVEFCSNNWKSIKNIWKEKIQIPISGIYPSPANAPLAYEILVLPFPCSQTHARQVLNELQKISHPDKLRFNKNPSKDDEKVANASTLLFNKLREIINDWHAYTTNSTKQDNEIINQNNKIIKDDMIDTISILTSSKIKTASVTHVSNLKIADAIYKNYDPNQTVDREPFPIMFETLDKMLSECINCKRIDLTVRLIKLGAAISKEQLQSPNLEGGIKAFLRLNQKDNNSLLIVFFDHLFLKASLVNPTKRLLSIAFKTALEENSNSNIEIIRYATKKNPNPTLLRHFFNSDPIWIHSDEKTIERKPEILSEDNFRSLLENTAWELKSDLENSASFDGFLKESYNNALKNSATINLFCCLISSDKILKLIRNCNSTALKDIQKELSTMNKKDNKSEMDIALVKLSNTLNSIDQKNPPAAIKPSAGKHNSVRLAAHFFEEQQAKNTNPSGSKTEKPNHTSTANMPTAP